MKNSLMDTYAPLGAIIEKGNGVLLYDTLGNEYIDFTSGIGVNSLGYNNELINNAIEKQIKKVCHVSNIFLNPTTVELSNKLTSISKMDKVFFCNSGAEANEGAIKLARKYSYDTYKTESRSTILTLYKSFHGRTIATLKATGQDKFHKYFSPFPEGFKYTDANNIESLKKSITPDVCAVMMEAIQGEGGVHPLDNKFVKEVYRICKEKDILLIFDEVQCGIGRTGEFFGFNHFPGVSPDIVTVAKGLGGGLPIGAFMCNKKLSKIFKPGDHGSTFGGNPVSSASALAVLDYVSDEDTLSTIRDNSDFLINLLSPKDNNNIVEVRGKGLMVGLETKLNSADIQREALKNGLLVLTAGPNVVRLLPPLVINREILKKGSKILLKVIDSLS